MFTLEPKSRICREYIRRIDESLVARRLTIYEIGEIRIAAKYSDRFSSRSESTAAGISYCVLAYDLGKRLQFTRNLLMEGLQRRS